jgi:hypothetical protein
MAFLDIPAGFSAAELAAHQVRRAIIDARDAVKGALEQIHTQLYLVDGVDPQDVFDDFATNGSKLVAFNDAAVAFLDDIATANGQAITDIIADAMHEPPAGKELVENVDHSITYQDI